MRFYYGDIYLHIDIDQHTKASLFHRPQQLWQLFPRDLHAVSLYMWNKNVEQS